MKKVKKILGVFVLVMVAVICMPKALEASEMSEEFLSYLNENGEFEVNAAKGTTDEDLALYLDFIYSNLDLSYDVLWGNISEDLNTFDFTIYSGDKELEETHTVKVKYNYDEKVNEVINNYLNTTLKDKTKFNVSDLELVSYWINNTGENNNSLALYSGELRKLLDYKNIQLFTDSRNGGSNPFITDNGGFASFQNNGISYKISSVLSAMAKHVIYIDESVGSTKEEVIGAVQKRIDDHFGKDIVTIEFAGEDVLEVYDDDYKQYILSVWEDPNSDYNFLHEAYNGWYFWAHTQIGDTMSSRFFVVKKDSTKMVKPIVKTVDSVTNVEISTKEKLPIDTTIEAKELKSGEEYEKISELLNLTDSLTYDLKLYSSGLDEYITTLDSGEFEVKIPIPENFKDKDLAIYYVDENDEIQDYPITYESSYAVFKTTHFSIYTLGYKNNNIGENPKTFDNISIIVASAIISLFGLAGTTIYLKKRSKVEI